MIAELFTWEFTLGNLITIALGIIAIAVSWGAFKTEMKILSKTVEDHDRQLSDIEKTGGTAAERTRVSLVDQVKDHEIRLRTIEHAVTKIDLIALDIKWIRRNLPRGQINLEENLTPGA